MPHPLILQGFGGVAPKVYFATTYIHSILQQPTFYLCKKHYKGVTTSTSALAQELLESDYQVQGTAYFTYEGEKLTDRRDRMEND